MKRLTPAQFGLALAAMAAVAVYRSLVMWAENAWDLTAPQGLFVFSLVVLLVELVAFLALVSVGVKPLASTIGVAGSMLVLLLWRTLPIAPAWVWLVAAVGIAVALQMFGRDRSLKTFALISAAVLAIAPAIQLGVAHARTSEPYPIVELAPREPVEATGDVEDVLVVIVDSYPSLRLANDWFDHDTDRLESDMTANGLTVAESGWSHNTFTGMAVPGMLELKPIVDEGPTPPWGNRRPMYDLVRGDSLVAASLKSAGYEYTHIESGWDAASCGPEVDRCMRAPWFKETTWNLLQPSVLAGWALSRYGNISVPGTKQAVEHVRSLEPEFDDGERDFVFAHLLLPHVPIVVDEECALDIESGHDTGNFDPEEAEPESAYEVAPQLACVDSLLADIVDIVGQRTAVLITGDHGTGSGGQVTRPAAEWSDADIAERFGVLLAYKTPPSCPTPASDSNLEVMRSIMTCAVNIELPAHNGRYLIGAENPEFVDPDRMSAIKAAVLQRRMQPDN